jgi:hypothetical protein
MRSCCAQGSRRILQRLAGCLYVVDQHWPLPCRRSCDWLEGVSHVCPSLLSSEADLRQRVSHPLQRVSGRQAAPLSKGRRQQLRLVVTALAAAPRVDGHWHKRIRPPLFPTLLQA